MSNEEMIAVIHAYGAGAAVECKLKDSCLDWLYAPNPQWNFNGFDYRIKPEPPKPREWWLRSHSVTGVPCTSCGMFDSLEQANRPSSDRMLTAAVIHVREVLDQE